MSRSKVRFVALHEDETSVDRRFIQALATRLGLTPLRFECGKGSAGVLAMVTKQVNALREKGDQKNLGLLIHLDADDHGLAQRHEQIDQELANTKLGARRDGERIVYLVPAREIETWYVHFCCPDERPVDETKDYKASAAWKKLAVESQPATRAVKEWDARSDRLDPASVNAARDELKRLG